jgi:GTP-binding protein Era
VSLINGVKHGEENAHLSCLDTTTFMISALQNDGVVDLVNYLISVALPKPWKLDKNMGPTNLTREERAEEMVLEMLMENTHDEIPYIADINCTSISSVEGDKIKVEVDIYVDSPQQQRIIVGHQGRTLVKIRQSAAAEMEKIFGKTVILYLWIKVRDEKESLN